MTSLDEVASLQQGCSPDAGERSVKLRQASLHEPLCGSKLRQSVVQIPDANVGIREVDQSFDLEGHVAA